MIVSLDALKRRLGIALDETDEDDALTVLIESAGTWVEGETHRRFDQPLARIEYRDGNNARRLFLAGHIDETPTEEESAGDAPLLVVSSRGRNDIGGDWEELVEGEDYERRGDVLLMPAMWQSWTWGVEYKLEYLDGYLEAPADIQALVLELASAQYAADVTSSEGTAGVTSEKLGDFAYTVDLGAVAATASTGLSATARATLNHYKRLLV